MFVGNTSEVRLNVENQGEVLRKDSSQQLRRRELIHEIITAQKDNSNSRIRQFVMDCFFQYLLFEPDSDVPELNRLKFFLFMRLENYS